MMFEFALDKMKNLKNVTSIFWLLLSTSYMEFNNLKEQQVSALVWETFLTGCQKFKEVSEKSFNKT